MPSVSKSKLALTDAAALALPKSALERHFVLESDYHDAGAESEASSLAYMAAVPDLQNAKAVKAQNKKWAAERGLEVDDTTDFRDDRAIETEQRKVDSAKARNVIAKERRANTETVLQSPVHYANRNALLGNKRRRAEPQKDERIDGVTVFHFLKPDAFKFEEVKTTLGLRKSETLSEFVDRRRAEITGKRAEQVSINDTWLSEEETFKGAIAAVDEICGRPGHTVRFWGKKATVRFAETKVAADPSGMTIPTAPDFRPAYVREHYDEIAADVRRQIAEHYRKNNIVVMSAEEKHKKLDKLSAEILALEREECQAIFQARKQGIYIAFRTDTDPRALLGIVGPPPSRRR